MERHLAFCQAKNKRALVTELVDVTDLKSVELAFVAVQVRPGAPSLNDTQSFPYKFFNCCFYFSVFSIFWVPYNFIKFKGFTA